MFSQREIYFKDGYDTEGFNITLNSLAAQYRIKAAGADIDALLRRYADMLKISYADYSALDAECKNYFEDCIRKLDSAKEPLYRFYELCIVKAKLAAAKRYQEFRAITEENAGILEITVTVSENAAEVFKLFYERRDEILSDISKAAQIFEECEKAVQNKKSDSSGGSSGSGSYWVRSEETRTNPQQTPQPTTLPDVNTLDDIAGHWAENVILSLFEKRICLFRALNLVP